jgi:hypothetical protein
MEPHTGGIDARPKLSPRIQPNSRPRPIQPIEFEIELAREVVARALAEKPGERFANARVQNRLVASPSSAWA